MSSELHEIVKPLLDAGVGPCKFSPGPNWNWILNTGGYYEMDDAAARPMWIGWLVEELKDYTFNLDWTRRPPTMHYLVDPEEEHYWKIGVNHPLNNAAEDPDLLTCLVKAWMQRQETQEVRREHRNDP